MENTPKFIRDFSKEESGEERQKVATEIRAKRAEYFEGKKNLSEQLDKVHKLETDVEELSDSGLNKLKNYFKLRKLRSELSTNQNEYSDLEKTDLESGSKNLDQARAMLDSFYKEQTKKWENSTYTKEDITKNFSEEHLSSLSLEEYELLLKRFPREMVAHVTRQGIRDHIGHAYHTKGAGAYSEGFMKIAEDGRLRSPLGIHLIETEKEKAVSNYLGLEQFETKEKALENLNGANMLNAGMSQMYADFMAVHFATEEVADAYYGSEKGNEIFIAYPSAHVASQYYFNGQLNKSGGGYWNDQWVWANEEKGMDINAGVVFIPEEAKVDKETGSRYELDENRNPIKNEKYISILKKLVEAEGFADFHQEIKKISGGMKGNEDEEVRAKLEPFRSKLREEFGITDPALQEMVLFDYHALSLPSADSHHDQEARQHLINREIENTLNDYGVLYEQAKNAVNSKEFWENYFAKNSDKKPSKIVYYKGSDPTKALREWQKKLGYYRGSEDKSLGFAEKNIQRNDERALAGFDRFQTLVQKALDDHFGVDKRELANEPLGNTAE